ncbi:helix-turn-helix transcriptional regulator [Williamsia deligens]|uniref:Helix-turn-helix transcriptional regulator n=1 Tax=Williamsia deligens TaxID=321325 RepID=A0ABW3G747_9NOCA|nr:helix-turn-helix transcriptional regulator [Williamsia deligens]MCP2192984.1 Helix-turn-helix domain-containing protein [Williamsia deligens]
MDSAGLAAFLRSRRARLRPEDVGMASGARRRTPGLRREEVAVLAHISTEYYVRLEQARAPRPSVEVVSAIARALRLTVAETDHLHDLTDTTPPRDGLVSRDVRPSIRALLDRLPLTAGFVISAIYDVLAWNDLARALMDDFEAVAPADRNLARRAFLPPDPDRSPLYGVSDLQDFRQGAVMQLRVAATRYPRDDSVRELIAELSEGSEEFARLWGRQDVEVPTMLRKTFRHRAVGDVTVDCDVLAIPEVDQHLVPCTAPVGSSDADALALLGVLGPEATSRG